MELISVAKLIGGLVLLVAGGEFLVRFASRLATSFGISALVVGLTVVAMGTSAPEMVVSTVSAWQGKTDIAYGNVVGSNICNVLLILGLSATVAPLVVQRKMVRVDTPVMVAAAALAYGLALDGVVGRFDGLLLIVLLVVYMVWSVRASLATPSALEEQFEKELAPKKLLTTYGRPLLVLGILASLALLVVGSDLFVDGAASIARRFGVSELVIGLTVVAAGTSMPEVVTSLVATLRGERDIAVGNVVGSNLFNTLGVLGGAASIAPEGVAVSSTALHVDTPLMLAACFACLPVFYSGWRISRGEGLMFLAYYVAYTSYLVLDAQGVAAAATLGRVVLWAALPVTGLALASASWRWRNAERRAYAG